MRWIYTFCLFRITHSHNLGSSISSNFRMRTRFRFFRYRRLSSSGAPCLEGLLVLFACRFGLWMFLFFLLLSLLHQCICTAQGFLRKILSLGKSFLSFLCRWKYQLIGQLMLWVLFHAWDEAALEMWCRLQHQMSLLKAVILNLTVRTNRSKALCQLHNPLKLIDFSKSCWCLLFFQFRSIHYIWFIIVQLHLAYF